MVAHDASSFYGLDPDHCKGSASAMQKEGQQLGGLMSNIQGLLDSVIWKGKNAENFMSNWDQTLKPKMSESAEQMESNGGELHRRVVMQEQASS